MCVCVFCSSKVFALQFRVWFAQAAVPPRSRAARTRARIALLILNEIAQVVSTSASTRPVIVNASPTARCSVRVFGEERGGWLVGGGLVVARAAILDTSAATVRDLPAHLRPCSHSRVRTAIPKLVHEF